MAAEYLKYFFANINEFWSLIDRQQFYTTFEAFRSKQNVEDPNWVPLLHVIFALTSRCLQIAETPPIKIGLDHEGFFKRSEAARRGAHRGHRGTKIVFIQLMVITALYKVLIRDLERAAAASISACTAIGELTSTSIFKQEAIRARATHLASAVISITRCVESLSGRLGPRAFVTLDDAFVPTDDGTSIPKLLEFRGAYVRSLYTRACLLEYDILHDVYQPSTHPDKLQGLEFEMLRLRWRFYDLRFLSTEDPCTKEVQSRLNTTEYNFISLKMNNIQTLLARPYLYRSNSNGCSRKLCVHLAYSFVRILPADRTFDSLMRFPCWWELIPQVGEAARILVFECQRLVRTGWSATSEVFEAARVSLQWLQRCACCCAEYVTLCSYLGAVLTKACQL